eukprot:NODE_316_length_11188_cov_0.303905.p6 type:complete len:151 gc:universal NODE_316_length_11188_cov_0.303905:1705-1253(-)
MFIETKYVNLIKISSLLFGQSVCRFCTCSKTCSVIADARASKISKTAINTCQNFLVMTIAAELQPLEHRVEKAIHALKEMQGQVYTASEIAKVQGLLHKVDEEYREGKFEKKGKIPEGQAELAEHLDEAHNLAQEMLKSAKEFSDEKEEQ